MHDYIRKVNYYETDKMGITHHSNYVRWMEEARIDFLEQHGCGYKRFEEEGIISPVLSVECQYKHSTTFDDEVKIHVAAVRYTGVSLTLQYTMTNQKTGDTVLTGKTGHCFTDRDGTPIIVKKKFPEFDSILRNLVLEKTV